MVSLAKMIKLAAKKENLSANHRRRENEMKYRKYSWLAESEKK